MKKTVAKLNWYFVTVFNLDKKMISKNIRKKQEEINAIKHDLIRKWEK